jgi:hypothetical protein
MAYVIKACADQSEAINAALPQKQCHILDILPGGEDSLNERKYKDGLANGSCLSVSPLIGSTSAAYNTIDNVVWKGEQTVFGCCVVCSV